MPHQANELPAVALFHAHLNVCAQCRNNPCGLCPTGADLLREASLSISSYFPLHNA